MESSSEEQATMVRLAQQASARVIAVDDFPAEQEDNQANPVIKPVEPAETADEAQA